MENKFYYKSVIGVIEIIVKNGKLMSLILVEKAEDNGKETELVKEIKLQLDEYFSGKRTNFDIKIEPVGTEFQKKVWKELQKIPYGKTKSYSEIAEKLGNRNSSRAVGNACNKNPILIVIPCHRVVSKSGSLSGFACGTKVKEKLLSIEKNIEAG